MSCWKFDALYIEVSALCLEKGVSGKSRDYLINKTSSYIRKSEFDIYYGYLSLDGFVTNGEIYISTHKIECHECTLYLCFVVD